MTSQEMITEFNLSNEWHEEGDVPKSRLYKEISEYENDLAHKIATSIPEWEDGKWE